MDGSCLFNGPSERVLRRVRSRACRVTRLRPLQCCGYTAIDWVNRIADRSVAPDQIGAIGRRS